VDAGGPAWLPIGGQVLGAGKTLDVSRGCPSARKDHKSKAELALVRRSEAPYAGARLSVRARRRICEEETDGSPTPSASSGRAYPTQLAQKNPRARTPSHSVRPESPRATGSCRISPGAWFPGVGQTSRLSVCWGKMRSAFLSGYAGDAPAVREYRTTGAYSLRPTLEITETAAPPTPCRGIRPVAGATVLRVPPLRCRACHRRSLRCFPNTSFRPPTADRFQFR
jgi:hypothetical protein